MKKIFYICLCLISVLAVNIFSQVGFFVVSAESIFHYEELDQGLSIGVSGVKDVSIADIVIPSTINDLPVVSILKGSNSNGEYFEFLSNEYREVIRSLDLTNADNLEIISAGAFADCVNLQGEIYLPSTITTIGRSAFSGTAISKVYVNSDNVINLGSGAFPEDVTIIYPSEALMLEYTAGDNADADWTQYNSVFTYSVVLDIDGVEHPLDITQISDCEFADNYNLIMQYLVGYNIISIKQGDEDLTANTIADGSKLIVKTTPSETDPVELTTQVNITYGDKLDIFTAPTDTAIYKWKFDGDNVDNTTNRLEYNDLTAGTYEAVCETYVDGVLTKIETFNIVVNKLAYTVKYPNQNRFVCLEFDNAVIIEEFNLDEVEHAFYYNNQLTETFGYLGEYRVETVLVDEMSDNYEIINPSFTFYLTPAEITVTWPSGIYDYTSEEIAPSYVISGNKWGHDLRLIMSQDSTLSATNVGNYHITITGLNSEYFELSGDTITTFNWQIVQTTLVVKWELDTYNYTSEEITPVAYGESGNIRIQLNVSEQNTGNTSFVDAATYSIVAEVPSEFTGFTLQGQTTNTITINPKRIEVVFTSNNEFTYNGEMISVVAEITSDIDEDVNLILSGNQYKDAGNYTAVVEGVDNPNYCIDDDITFDWVINPKLLIVNWHPNTNPIRYVYNGQVQKPRARVETGIEGETLQLIIESDQNILANEDATTGYLAVAKLSDDIINYTLSNSSVRYYITRATAEISVQPHYSVPYTGENQLPEFYFNGDEGSLKITLNGLEIINGVKDPGTYEVKISAAKSQNYNATEEVTCWFTIKEISITNTANDGSIVVKMTDEKGIDIVELPVEVISNFDSAMLQSVDNLDDYYLYKAITVGRPNEAFGNCSLEFTLNCINRDVRVFLITKNGLEEKEVLVQDGVVSFMGGQGDYVILVERQSWWTTAWGITTIAVIVFAVVVAGLVVAIMARPKQAMLDKEVNDELERLITYKANNGEQFTSEDIKRLRKEIKDNIKKNKKDN